MDRGKRFRKSLLQGYKMSSEPVKPFVEIYVSDWLKLSLLGFLLIACLKSFVYAFSESVYGVETGFVAPARSAGYRYLQSHEPPTSLAANDFEPRVPLIHRSFPKQVRSYNDIGASGDRREYFRRVVEFVNEGGGGDSLSEFVGINEKGKVVIVDPTGSSSDGIITAEHFSRWKKSNEFDDGHSGALSEQTEGSSVAESVDILTIKPAFHITNWIASRSISSFIEGTLGENSIKSMRETGECATGFFVLALRLGCSALVAIGIIIVWRLASFTPYSHDT